MNVARELWKGIVCLLLALASAPLCAQTVEYIHTDALGTPVAVTNSAGVVVERSEYEPYGALLNRPITDGPGFTGHVQDAATGLTYMQQRYYDPGIGRFLSVDPITADAASGANFNRYWYVNNNPYNFTDPDGRQACGKDTTCRLEQGERGGTSGTMQVTPTKSFASVLGQRARTPSSQAKLIEDVGGDSNTLKQARATHESFVTTLIGVVAGGGFGGTGKGGTTTLYRAVDEAEAMSIRATGKFSAGPNSLGGKWLAESLKHARQWGDALNGKGLSRLLEVRLPKPVADQLMRLERLDGIGPARFGELDQLEKATIRELP